MRLLPSEEMEKAHKLAYKGRNLPLLRTLQASVGGSLGLDPTKTPRVHSADFIATRETRSPETLPKGMIALSGIRWSVLSQEVPVCQALLV